jgi:hypothetical protein
MARNGVKRPFIGLLIFETPSIYALAQKIAGKIKSSLTGILHQCFCFSNFSANFQQNNVQITNGLYIIISRP